MNMHLIIAGLIGFTSIAMGALGDHLLRPTLDPEAMRSFMTAVRLHQLHAVILLILAMSRDTITPRTTFFTTAFWCFTLGIALFSGGIYLAYWLHMPALKNLAPFGGSTLMLGWLTLAAAGMKRA